MDTPHPTCSEQPRVLSTRALGVELGSGPEAQTHRTCLIISMSNPSGSDLFSASYVLASHYSPLSQPWLILAILISSPVLVI